MHSRCMSRKLHFLVFAYFDNKSCGFRESGIGRAWAMMDGAGGNIGLPLVVDKIRLELASPNLFAATTMGEQ